MSIVDAIRGGRFSPDTLTRALLIDIGLGQVISALENYCGITATKWLLRLFALFIVIAMAHHVLLWSLGMPLHEAIGAARAIEIPAIDHWLFNFAIRVAGSFIIVLIIFIVADRIVGRATKYAVREALKTIEEARQLSENAETKMAEAESRIAEASAILSRQERPDSNGNHE